MLVESLSDYRLDKKFRTYLASMKQACNEALTQLYAICEPKVMTTKIEIPRDTSLIDLSEIIPDFGSIYEIETPNNATWKQITKNIIKVEGGKGGFMTVIYAAKNIFIDNTTTDATVIPLEEEYARIIPLYIAGELYKDDDLTVATVYMNEFSTMVNLIMGKNSSVNFNATYRMDI